MGEFGDPSVFSAITSIAHLEFKSQINKPVSHIIHPQVT